MRSPAELIRSASFLAVSNGIGFVAGVDVIVYDAFALDNAVFPRVILQGITGGGPKFSKCGFGGDWFQSIKISSAFRMGGTTNYNETIVDNILEVLCPPNGPYLNLGEPFHIWNAYGQILNTLTYDDGVVKYIDTDIQITYSITESN